MILPKYTLDNIIDKAKKENKNKLLRSTNNALLSFSYIIEIPKSSILRGSKWYMMENSEETKIKQLESSINL